MNQLLKIGAKQAVKESGYTGGDGSGIGFFGYIVLGIIALLFLILIIWVFYSLIKQIIDEIKRGREYGIRNCSFSTIIGNIVILFILSAPIVSGILFIFNYEP